MFDTPRCREWTPLATQQLRLRNLIQIVGYNIRPPEQRVPVRSCSYYYTLHETGMSAPFYTSERLVSPHPKWQELRADVTQWKPSANVVIRIWCHDEHNSRPDQTIQTWGVYFNGLRLIGANLALDFTSESFKPNTLVFQMHGGYFCSYGSLNLKRIPSENLYEYSVSSSSSGTNVSECNYLQNHRIIKESRSMSPGQKFKAEEISKSHSPTERAFKQNFAKLKPSQSLNIQRSEWQDENAYEELIQDLSTDQGAIPKVRYLALDFLKSEIRPSYNATKLQNLHVLQYSIKKRKDDVKLLKERIYKKSAMDRQESPTDCQLVSPRRKVERDLFLTEEEDSTPCEEVKEEKAPNGPRLTLKLNDLLSDKTRPSRQQRAEHARLTRQLELLRFKRSLLVDERDYKMAAIRNLKAAQRKLYEENEDMGSELMTGYHSLARRTDRLRQSRQSAAALREIAGTAAVALQSRRERLLRELAELFAIECSNDKWSIHGHNLPIFDEDTRRPATQAHTVAAAMAAHCTKVAAAILDQPLRYPVLIGGVVEIVDELTQQLTDPKVALYGGGADTSQFRYALFLLNKCLVQLARARGTPLDARRTLYTLCELLTGQLSRPRAALSDHSQSLRSLVASEREHVRPFNRFKDYVDARSPGLEHCMKRHRLSRSVGSCRDDREIRRLDMSTTSMAGSEPFLNEVKSDMLVNGLQLTPIPHAASSHTSQVLFTMGGEELHARAPVLVKTSANNGDESTSTKSDGDILVSDRVLGVLDGEVLPERVGAFAASRGSCEKLGTEMELLKIESDKILDDVKNVCEKASECYELTRSNLERLQLGEEFSCAREMQLCQLDSVVMCETEKAIETARDLEPVSVVTDEENCDIGEGNGTARSEL